MTKDQKPQQAESGAEVDEQVIDRQLSNWQFIGGPPTGDKLISMLKTVAPVWGVDIAEFADYITALSQKMKYRRPHPDKPSLMIDDYVEAYSLYMSVAGRIHMINRAAEDNGWVVSFIPEETVTPPGYLSFADRLVYRVHVEIREDDRLIGRRSGTAWVPYSGGSNAAGSNPYEKVETSALGRALGAWGFGVLPGSGVATMEEMQNMVENRRHMDSAAGRSARAQEAQSEQRDHRPDRADLLAQTYQLSEQARIAKGDTVETWNQKTADFIGTRMGATEAVVNGEVVWGKVRDGVLQILMNQYREVLRTE